MITKSKLRKLANSHTRKTERKDTLYAYKLMCKNIKERARKGYFSYSFSTQGYGEVMPVAFRFFSSKHRDLDCTVSKYEETTSYVIRW